MSIGTPHYETLAGFSPLSTLGPYRAADYWKLPEGEPIELIHGRLIMSPSPSSFHQTLLLCLAQKLWQIASESGGRVLMAPMDVVLSDNTIVQPDILYVAAAQRGIVGERVNGAPDLVIEILSESNVRRDRVDKLNLYAEYGVAEYWLVDPKERQFDFLVRNEQGRFEVQLQQDNRYESPRLAELTLNLIDFWAEVDRHVK